jgi:hypothetical protein
VADPKVKSGVFAPPVHDEKFCTVVLRVRPGTGQIGRPEVTSLYICTKSVPCPDHPQGPTIRPALRARRWGA